MKRVRWLTYGPPSYHEPVLALLANLSLVEILVFVVVAILVFGRNLPEVASDAARKIGRLRRTLENLRRESGIDQEIREVRRSLQDGLTGNDRPIRPRDLPGAVAKRALEQAGINDETRREIAEADPRRALESLEQEVRGTVKPAPNPHAQEPEAEPPAD